MKQALKILGLAALAVLVIGGAGVYFFVHQFKQDMAGIMVLQERRDAEVARIDSLPELRGVIAADSVTEAPFSHARVALCVLRQGRQVQLSGPSSGGGSGPSSGRTYTFKDQVVVVPPAAVVLSIAGIGHRFRLDSLILSRLPSPREDAPHTNGFAGGTFESNRMTDLLDPQHDDDERNIQALQGRSALIDAYIRKGTRLGDPEVRLDEVLFLAGDTLSFHGRIEGDTLVPLF